MLKPIQNREKDLTDINETGNRMSKLDQSTLLHLWPVIAQIPLDIYQHGSLSHGMHQDISK